MPKKIDITDEKYGRLTVLKEVEPKGYSRRFLCRCKCGNETIVYMSALRKKTTQSCGCIQREKASQSNLKDLTNKTFGMLTAIERVNTKSKSRKAIWKCLCECGNFTNVESDKLLNKTTKSCGCLREKIGNDLQEYNKDKLVTDGVFTPILKSKVRVDSSTGIKGVVPVKRKNTIKYQATISIKKKAIYLGTYDTIEEAAKVRKKAEKEYHEPYIKALEEKQNERD
ncbi:hypothetical protein MXL46_08075 [Heyndrickxia sporothermodurans]|uniref:hypothetical protein n=1 Tax=Heyndrickxia sporothermodurans TaxID=46224 RepID=UPI002DBBD022|nr:hypothetical protein [Heyndrickxia sporothermodurans]MEB6549051.1 hypothetical protein [Heyndrickxia sporothermodurans]